MKILHIPPEYLDNATLLAEKELLERVILKISDENWSIDSHDRIVLKYYSHPKYLFLRLIAIIDKLEERGVIESDSFDPNLTLNEISDIADEEYQFTVDSISKDVDLIYSIWQEYIDYDSTIPSLIEELSLVSSEELYQEMTGILLKYKERFGL